MSLRNLPKRVKPNDSIKLEMHCPYCGELLHPDVDKNLVEKYEMQLLPQFCSKCDACINNTTIQPDKGDKLEVKAREDFLRTNDFFMAMAFMMADRNSCDDLKVGAVLVENNKKIWELFATSTLKDLKNEIESKLSKYEDSSKFSLYLSKYEDLSKFSLYLSVQPDDETFVLLENSTLQKVLFMPHEMNYSKKKGKITAYKPTRVSQIIIKPHESNKLSEAPDFKWPNTKQTVSKEEKDQFFIQVCYLSGMRSEDPSKQVGACITNENDTIIGTGYNYMREQGSDYERKPDSKGNRAKNDRIVFSHIDAMENLTERDNLDKCTLYLTIFPTSDQIVKNIVYTPTGKFLQKKFNLEKLVRELNEKGIAYRPFDHEAKKLVTIDFYANLKRNVFIESKS